MPEGAVKRVSYREYLIAATQEVDLRFAVVEGRCPNAQREAGFGGARQNRQTVDRFTNSRADLLDRFDEHSLECCRSSLI
jgi:hypothetical protein